MSVKTALKSRVIQSLLSDWSLGMRRGLSDFRRAVDRRDHEILYFHRADDPYCQLMVQVIPELLERFDVRIKPRVVERLPAKMYPDPARYEAYSILDATRIARQYGLGFPRSAKVPDPLSVGMINRHLVNLEDSADFFASAEELGAALWRRNLGAIQDQCRVAQVEEDRLRENERTLVRLGHYASGTLYYEGEFYPGIDRLDHLERRLNDLGAGDGGTQYELGKLWGEELHHEPFRAVGQNVDLYFSVRSPFSYMALEQAAALHKLTGVQLRLRPVLPMVNRGLAVPEAKKRYILTDVKRECGLYGLPFGRIHDPLGQGVSNCLAIGDGLAGEDEELDFYRSAARAIWSEGLDVSDASVLEKICKRAGVDWRDARVYLGMDRWKKTVEGNRSDLAMLGGWGVPAFHTGRTVVFGQDRVWGVVQALREAAGDEIDRTANL